MESGKLGGGILRECNEIVEGRSFLEPLCCNLHEFRNFYFTYFTGKSFAKGRFSRTNDFELS